MTHEDDNLAPWTRQPSEPPRAYHWFAHYRDLGVGRSFDKAYREHQAACDGVPVGARTRAPRHWTRAAAR